MSLAAEPVRPARPRLDARGAPRAHELPLLPSAGGPLDARACRQRGTGLALGVAWTVAGVSFALVTVLSQGLSLLGLALWPLLARGMAKRARALVRGNGVLVGPDQLPAIHACATAFAARLGLPRAPEVYVVSGAVPNAFAVRFGRLDAILLTDEVVDACLRGGSPGALAFVIGHELGHVALKHTRLLRSHVRLAWRRLSRLDELAADAVGARLVGSPDDAALGVALLCAGPKLLPYLDVDALRRQAREVARDKWARKVERASTHPLTMHRLVALEGLTAGSSDAPRDAIAA